MEEKLFRESSLKRIKSPDNLGQYIKVANPGIWMILTAILAFVIGGIFWCVYADLETTVSTAIVATNGHASCYLGEDWQRYINDDMYVEINNVRYKLGERSKEMAKLDETSEKDFTLLHMMFAEKGGWYYVYDIEGIALENGVYQGSIIVDSVNPISFVLNGN